MKGGRGGGEECAEGVMAGKKYSRNAPRLSTSLG